MGNNAANFLTLTEVLRCLVPIGILCRSCGVRGVALRRVTRLSLNSCRVSHGQQRRELPHSDRGAAMPGPDRNSLPILRRSWSRSQKSDAAIFELVSG